MRQQLSRRGFLAGSAVSLAAATTAAGCNTASASADSVKIGWIIPQKGAYKSIGDEMNAGMKLYLDVHDNKLGGRDVELITGEEGETPKTAFPTAEKLVKKEQAVVLAGIVSGGAYAKIAPFARERKVPLIGAGGRPDLDPDELDWLWHASWISTENGTAVAPYIHENVDGPVYAIGPGYQGGYDQLKGFTETFTDLGGELANPDGKTTWTEFPATEDFLPFFSKIAESGAAAIYAFYAGEPAVNFVTQWAKSDAKDIPLYGSFLTEGSVLDAQGEAAEGVYSVMNYSSDLDNEANRNFVSEWQARNDGVPYLYAMCAWDTAQVLDKAIGSIPKGETVTSEAINEAIKKLGEIDSPRGKWKFSKKAHSPIQPWYLREVKKDGKKLANVVIEDLQTLG